MKKGNRCKLLGNPPKHKSGNGTGDELDGVGIAVSQHIQEYHAFGSLITPNGDFPEGGIWVHVYKRISRKSDTFRYIDSHTFSSSKRFDEHLSNRDNENFGKLIG